MTLSRKKQSNGEYDYYMYENHTVNQIIQDIGINEILKDFSKEERNKLLILADQIRLGLEK